MGRIAAFFRVLIPLLLSILPGWGHIWVRRFNRGLSLFMIFFTIANGWLLLFLNARDEDNPKLVMACMAALVGIWVFTFVDIIRITVWLKGKTFANRRKGLYRRSLIHYLRGEYEQAEDQARRMIRSDPLDASALLVLGMVQRESGEPKRAISTFRRALRSSTTDYWKDDLRREISATRGIIS